MISPCVRPFCSGLLRSGERPLSLEAYPDHIILWPIVFQGVSDHLSNELRRHIPTPEARDEAKDLGSFILVAERRANLLREEAALAKGEPPVRPGLPGSPQSEKV